MSIGLICILVFLNSILELIIFLQYIRMLTTEKAFSQNSITQVTSTVMAKWKSWPFPCTSRLEIPANLLNVTFLIWLVTVLSIRTMCYHIMSSLLVHNKVTLRLPIITPTNYLLWITMAMGRLIYVILMKVESIYILLMFQEVPLQREK